jgi:murein DD-endopeptidase MepM/ murein hydrolase activator NlpD|tara:strand:- start:429 stop:1151 length:723 start_codon:yes stop_codon:yes gene_type:complete
VKNFLTIIFIILLFPPSSNGNDLTDADEIYKALHEIKSGRTYKGKTGYVMRKDNEKNFSKFPIILPKNSAPIVSDYKSRWGASMSATKRDTKHYGVDFYMKAGDQILAANDGKVVFAKNDKCAGNVITIRHAGSIYASYLHVGDFKVKKGDKVKRGQLIASAGKHGNTRCSGNIDHLHFQTSKAGPCSQCTGSWKYLGRKESWTNAHNYWTGGKGKPECYVTEKIYSKKKFTLPFKCKNL